MAATAAENFGFDPDRLYRPNDEAMRAIATVGQLAQWRHYKRGLPFITIAGNVYYSGADIIQHLKEGRVEPKVKPKAKAA